MSSRLDKRFQIIAETFIMRSRWGARKCLERIPVLFTFFGRLTNSEGMGLLSVRDPGSVYCIASRLFAHGFHLPAQDGCSSTSVMFAIQAGGRKKRIPL